MEIRMNDKVQIEGTVIADCGEYFHMRIAPNVTAYDLKKTWVTKIVERAESDAEKIARLEKRVLELEGLVDLILPDAPINQLADHDGLSKQNYDVQILDKPVSPWYPPQLEGYGPWTEGTPPEDFTGTAQLLMKFERNCETYCEGAYVLERGFVLGCDYVAYCVKL